MKQLEKLDLANPNDVQELYAWAIKTRNRMKRGTYKKWQPTQRQKDNAEKIIKFLCSFHSIKYEEITNCTRKKKIVKARQQAMSILCNQVKLSESQVGLIFGGKDHSSVNHSKKQVLYDCSYHNYRSELEYIIRVISRKILKKDN